MATYAKFHLMETVGLSGNLATAQLWAPGTSELTSMASHTSKLLGVTIADANAGEDIQVMRDGYLRGVTEQNGETWAAGEVLYGKTDGTGSITHTRPTAPATIVIVGVYLGSGVVDVHVREVPTITGLSGVQLDAPADKDILIYNSASGYYETRQMDHGADIAPTSLLDDDHPQYLQRLQYRMSHTHKLEDITNFTIGDAILAAQIFGS